MSGSVSAEDLSIADDPAFSKDPFIRAKSLKVGVEVMPLIFSKTLHVTDITLDKPEIALLRDASGKWNFSSLGSKLRDFGEAGLREYRIAFDRESFRQQAGREGWPPLGESGQLVDQASRL